MKNNSSFLRLKLSIFVIVGCVISFYSTSSFGAYYPPRIINIRPAGTSHPNIAGSPVLPSTNRIFRAYPGIEYNIRPAVWGGAYPFTYSLSNAPSGMTINSSTGEISWPNPQSNSGTITLTVTDSDKTVVNAQWAITVSTSGFYFINSNYTGGTTNGAINTPFKTLLAACTAVKDATAIFYFRNGTYDLFQTYFDDGKAMVIHADRTTAQTWLGYPNETAVIRGNNTYVYAQYGYFDNLTFGTANNMVVANRDFDIGAIKFWGGPSGNLATVRRCKFRNLHGITSVNLNQGFILGTSEPATGNYTQYGFFMVLQDNDFGYFSGAEPIGSLYARSYTLIEDNYVHDGGLQASGIGATEVVGAKREMFYTAVRHNKFIYPSNASVVYESYNSYYGTDQEISFNLIAHGSTSGMAFNIYFTPRTYVHRNTIIGRVGEQALTSGNSSGTACGSVGPSNGVFGYNPYSTIMPHVFSNNVIINPNNNYSWGPGNYNNANYFGFYAATAANGYSCITDSNNLKSTSLTTVIDSNSVTAGTYTLVNRSYVGTYGYETSGITLRLLNYTNP